MDIKEETSYIKKMIPELGKLLNERHKQIFTAIVENYMLTGDTTGSKLLSQSIGLSPASLRNAMKELEENGFLFAPHTSAGRLPTDKGLRLYVDGLMSHGDLTSQERAALEVSCSSQGNDYRQVFENTTRTLSALSKTTSLVVAPKHDKALASVQFTRLSDEKVLCILVFKDGEVENRLMEVPSNFPNSALEKASNYLNAKLTGHTLRGLHQVIQNDIENRKNEIDILSEKLIQQGIALKNSGSQSGHIIVRGRSELLNDLKNESTLEAVRDLMSLLEEEKTISQLLETADISDGVQIFIGSENRIFQHSGWSMVLSPYRDDQSNLIGAIGVIGPSNINYGRIIPMVDYTAQIMAKMLHKTH